MAPPPKPQVFFSTTTTSTTKYTWATVALDGTGFKVEPNIPTNMDLCDLGLSGISGPANVRRDRPQAVFFGNSTTSDGEDSITLPGGHGRLLRFYDGTHYGLAIAHPNATIDPLFDQGATTSATNSCASTYRVAVSTDGTLAAVVLVGVRVALLKLDGTTWSGTTPASPLKEITPTGVTFTSVYQNSLTLGATQVLFVAKNAAGNRILWSAPRDGSSVAQAIPMPQVGGNTPSYITTPLTMSADGTTFATTAGASNSKEDLIVIKGATATNVSNINDNLYNAGTLLGDSLGPQIALSTTGKYVVYGATSSAASAYKKKAWVVKTDGTGAIEISNSGNFVRSASGTTDVDNYGSYLWTSDDDLLFWAGKSSTSMDLFHYRVSTNALFNLTKTGTKSAAPWDGGAWESDGAWVSPTGAHVYYIAGTSSAMNIIGVDTATFAKFDITTGLNI
ncbi:MAG: hypothetical protein KAI47_20800, partial [Deltaproteobacteria bacterium]|nr:hypothetical protein [Deltaproteobacteria bacterium]